MGTIYFDTGGHAQNSGSSDNNSPDLSGSAATVAASVVSLDGSPDLSGLITSGDAQSTIYLADATNGNMKIFWITAFDNTLKTVTVSVAPTGVTSSVWRIGGRILHSATSVGTTEGAVRAGDIVQFNNSPAAIATSPWTCRAAGNSTSGPITLRGVSGSRPVLECTGSGLNCIAQNSQAGWAIENLELIQSHASSGAALTSGTGWQVRNVKISDAPNSGFQPGAGATYFSNSEISGCNPGLNLGSIGFTMHGCYVHDNASQGVLVAGSASGLIFACNIIESNSDQGIYYSGVSTSYPGSGLISHNTIALNGNSGLQVTDQDQGLFIRNNIFYENGDAAGEYNVEWINGNAENVGQHDYNCFYHSGAGGGANLFGLTPNSTEFTTDPLFIDAANGDFRLRGNSPGRNSGFPGQFLGGPLGYLDCGAVQSKKTSPKARSMLGI